MRESLFAAAVLLITSAHPSAHQSAQQNTPLGAVVRELAAVRLSGPTFFADGKTRGASIGLGGRWFLNQPIEFFQYSGKSLCMSASATREAPGDAGYGWRISILPIRVTNGLELEVEWERKWERGATVSAPRGKSRVSLQGGDKVMLDYIPAGAATPGCDAIGMGLQIEMLPVPAEAVAEIVEADIWLVRKTTDETIERQTIRIRPGEATPFYFRDVAIAIKGPLKINNSYYFQSKTDGPSLTVRTTGRLTPTLIRGERITATIEISQGIKAIGDVTSGGLSSRPAQAGETTQHGALYDLMAKRGGATSEFTAVPAEVVEFGVPELSGGERLVIRVQMKVLSK